ncbi:MAG: peptide deformylase, partial [Pseudomonadales bacterium]|nr:peptide deformylase [Pseudomonadales bacterium]
MSIHPIIKMGHPTLRKVASPVTPSDIDRPEMRTLIADMVETLHDAGGIGLAAPQINQPIQLAIIEVPGGPSRYGDIEPIPLTVFFNPEMTVLNPAEAGYWEGCLSVPGLRGFVHRPQHVRVNYLDITGKQASLELEGFLATVVQHEFD